MAVAATDVLAAARTAWAADAALAGLIPADRVYTSRADCDDPTRPYAVLGCAFDSAEPTTGPALVSWALDVTVYATTEADLTALLRAAPQALTALTVAGATQTLPTRPRAGGGPPATTGERLSGADLVTGGRAFRVTTAVPSWAG